MRYLIFACLLFDALSITASHQALGRGSGYPYAVAMILLTVNFAAALLVKLGQRRSHE